MNLINKIIPLIRSHKIIAVIGLIGVCLGGYLTYHYATSGSLKTRYQFSTVERGTIIKSVSGSGQIVASSQIEIKPKVSGDVIKVAVKKGQEVKAGDLLIQLDSGDAWKDVRDAQLNLRSAQLAYKEVKDGATEAELLQAENSLNSAKTTVEKLKLSQQDGYMEALETKDKLKDSIVKSYDDMFNEISDSFLDFPDVITGLNEVLYGDGIADAEIAVNSGTLNLDALVNTIRKEGNKGKVVSLRALAESNYKEARTKYDTTFSEYKYLTRASQQEDLNSFLQKTIDLTRSLFETAKSESNLLDSWVDVQTIEGASIFSTVTAYQNDLAGYLGTINSHLTSLLSVESTLESNIISLAQKERNIQSLVQNNPLDLASAEATLKERQLAYDKIKAGPDEADLLTQEISLRQRQNALLDAQENYAEYAVKAPFDGVVADLNITKGDSVTSSLSIATIITKQQTAVLSLNEVDVAKVDVGQKANVTFDALDDLNITGQVAEVDSLGTTSQGVVSYEVKILLDVQDEQVKPGMSVSVDITTEAKTDVLVIPSSAIKSLGETYYVQIPNKKITDSDAFSTAGIEYPGEFTMQVIETGMSSDTDTEVMSGLAEGDQILLKTIANTNNNNSNGATQTKSLLQTTAGMGGGMGRVPMGR